MRTLCKVGCALMLTAVLALAAGAQQQQRQKGQGFGGFGGFGGGFGGAGMLISNKSVQEELKLSKEQTDKVAAAMEKQREKQREAFTKLQDVPQDERREKFAALMKTANEENTKVVAEILNPEQQKRLRQIELQQRGAQAFTDPDVDKVLKLTDEQKEKLKTIAEDSRKEQQEAFAAARNNPQGLLQKMASMRKESTERSMAILKDDQKTALKELTGAPFEVKYEAGTGAFGGRPGGKTKDKNQDK